MSLDSWISRVDLDQATDLVINLPSIIGNSTLLSVDADTQQPFPDY